MIKKFYWNTLLTRIIHRGCKDEILIDSQYSYYTYPYNCFESQIMFTPTCASEKTFLPIGIRFIIKW